jgi:hypothetical protein
MVSCERRWGISEPYNKRSGAHVLGPHVSQRQHEVLRAAAQRRRGAPGLKLHGDRRDERGQDRPRRPIPIRRVAWKE